MALRNERDEITKEQKNHWPLVSGQYGNVRKKKVFSRMVSAIPLVRDETDHSSIKGDGQLEPRNLLLALQYDGFPTFRSKASSTCEYPRVFVVIEPKTTDCEQPSSSWSL